MFVKSMNLSLRFQIRVQHPDAHYAAAQWRYMREQAVQEKDICQLISLDDKHKVKVRILLSKVWEMYLYSNAQCFFIVVKSIHIS